MILILGSKRFKGVGLKHLSVLSLLWVSPISLWAFSNNYRTLLPGDRAVGLGGSFSSISDDPSGAYYNPAGLIFSVENYFNLSANVYHASTRTYKKTVGECDWVQKEGGLAPTFFGFTQTVGKAKLAFTIVVDDHAQIDQDDTLGLTQNGKQCFVPRQSASTGKWSLNEKFIRRFDLLRKNYLAGPSISYEPFKNFTVGLTTYGGWYTQNQVDHQFLKRKTGSDSSASDGAEQYELSVNHNTEEFWYLQPILGIQYMASSRLSFGASLRRNFMFTGSVANVLARLDLDKSVTQLDPSALVGKDFVGSMMPEPWIANFGGTFFANKNFLFTAELMYATSARYREKKTWTDSTGASIDISKLHNSQNVCASGSANENIGTCAKSDTYYGTDLNIAVDVSPVLNWSVAAEYFILPFLPMRLGVFSDYSNSPAIPQNSNSACEEGFSSANARKNCVYNMRDSIDNYGISSSLSFASPGSALTFGGVYYLGQGRSQLVSNSANVQQVQSNGFVIFFSGSYQI